MYRVCIDAGHGGKDPGAIGPSGLREKDINLAIALKIKKKLLETNKSLVFMTREDDKYVALVDRRKFAKLNRCDLLISIHCNSYSDKTSNGIEVFYAEDNRLSKAVAIALLDKLIEATKLRNRGIKTANFAVTKVLPPMAAVLAEIGFISNPKEESLLASEEYQDKVAKVIYDLAFGLSELNNVLKL